MDNAPQDGASSAIADGRRIYMGNLLYSVKPEDVDALLQENNLGKYDKIHLSFDPVSARNPGYCFVEFFHRDDANQALEVLAGAELAGRPVKVGPCHTKAPSQRQAGGRTRESRDEPQPTPRWGDWRGEKQAAGAGSERERSQHSAIRHHEEMAADGQGRRLFVGGLAKMINQEQHQEEITAYFTGYDVKAIGKRITPREETKTMPGNYHYCFVDMASPEEAQRAMTGLNGQEIPSGILKVSMAKPPRARESDGAYSPRRTGEDENGGRPREKAPQQPMRSLMSNNWRSKAT